MRMDCEFFRDLLLTADLIQRIRPDALVPLAPPLFFTHLDFSRDRDCLEGCASEFISDGIEYYCHPVRFNDPCPHFWEFITRLPDRRTIPTHRDFDGIYNDRLYRPDLP